MKALSIRIFRTAAKLSLLAGMVILSISANFAQSQATAADLTGTVVDPGEAVVAGASVTARNSETGISRTATSNESGEFTIIGLPPGNYEVTAEAATFKKTVVSPVRLTVGQRAELPIKLEIGANDTVVNVSGDSVELVETNRTAVSNTIDQRRVENLPVNERSATGFALTISTVGRDNGRPVGPAPTSGLNIGGQRGRSTLLQVDGADFTDNSVNAARTTVSQEAVQEFQVATNSYAPEFGRATGGVVNVVTKRGTNDFKGNVFGFLRNKNIQANNPFSPIDKAPFTRAQYGATFGGPVVKDKTFYFLAFEQRQRNESGFFTSDVTQGLNSSITLGAPILPFTQTFSRLSATQAQFAQGLIASGNPTAIGAAVQYLYLASSGGITGLTGTNPLVSAGGAIPAGQQVGARFFLSGAPVPVGTRNSNGQPIAFRPLLDLQRIFPIRDRTNYFSVRADQNINKDNQLTFRLGYNPSRISGIQVESQNQSLGQNDFSRTGIQRLRDYAFTTNLITTFGNRVNDLRFNFGRRETSFRSQNNDAVSSNIADTAFIGRELFSPVERAENRFQLADNVTMVLGSHTAKFGVDLNYVDITRAAFELNFAGLFNFGETNPAFLNPGFAGFPNLTPVQSYGLGLPSTYIQGFGNPNSTIKNKPIAFFAQDSWRVTNRLTLNYGVRYDIEFTEQKAPVSFNDPLSKINLSAGDILAAQNAVNVQQGFPVDKNNIAPRFAFAYDAFGTGKTIVRGAIGLFYDHPLLAVAFNSDIADAAQQQQAVLTLGSPASNALLNAAQVFQGTVCVPGAPLTPVCAAQPGVVTPGVAPGTEYQFGRQRFNDQTFPGFGPVLPFTLPVTKDFQYASTTQANFGIEHQLTKNMSVSASYIFVGAHHLPHPIDLNAPDTALQIENFRRFTATAANPQGTLPTNTTQAINFSVPTATSAAYTVVIPGIIAVNNATGLRFVNPAVANFFRPSAPNYFLTQALTGGAVTPAILNSQLAGSLRTAGTVSPFGSINA